MTSPPVIPAARSYKKKVLSLQQRLLLITQVQNKVPLDVLAARSGITERGVRMIFSRRKQVWRPASGGVLHRLRAAQASTFQLVAAKLYDWFTRVRKEGSMQSPISLLTLKTRAGLYASEFYPNRPFKASNSIFECFFASTLPQEHPPPWYGRLNPAGGSRKGDERAARQNGGDEPRHDFQHG